MNDPILCYIDGPWAWFTTCPLEKQWGDDWNDAPYEHNARRPYEWRDGGDVSRYELTQIAWSGPFITPDDGCFNSVFSVAAINRGDIAWLRPSCAPPKTPPIPAGTTLKEFCRIIRAAGGSVYVEAP